MLLFATAGVLSAALLIASAVGLLMATLSLGATWWHLRDVPKRAIELPPVSLLKPLKGLEDDLETNLRSFFAQDYPAPFEIIFSSADPDDEALSLARKIAADYEVPVRFVVTDEHFGLNPKVANLAGAMQSVRYDLVHQSDANVRVSTDYVRKIVGELIAADASMLSSVVVGVGEKNMGAALENLQLSAFIGPATCLALRVVNVTCVCGKSMLFYRSELERDVGGLESVRNVLCEDFILGERYKALGKKVLLSPTRVQNVNQECGVDRFVARHGRWLKMRATLHVPGFIADLLANPIALAFLALVAAAFEGTLGFSAAIGVCIVALKILLDQATLRIMRAPMALRYAFLTPVKDMMLLPMWIIAVFNRTVVWRGRRLHFGHQTKLIARGSTAPPKVADPYPAE